MKIKLVIIIGLIFSSFSFSQRYKIHEGKLKNLKGVTSYQVEFNYENVEVHGFDSEEDFLKEKMEKRKANPDKAEAFRRDWFLNREKYYHPAFIEFFNTIVKKKGCEITETSSHIMKVNVTWVYPGYLVEPAKISAIIDFYEIENPEQKILSIEFKKNIGYEKNTFVGKEYERFIGAYKKLAKNLALQINRVL